MSAPRARLTMKVLVPGGLVQMHPAEDQNIGPAISAEVVDKGVHAVRGASRRIERHRRIDLVSSLERRAVVPVRAGDDVGVTVAIEVADVDAVAIVLVGQNPFLKMGFRRDRRGNDNGREAEHRHEAEEMQAQTAAWIRLSQVNHGRGSRPVAGSVGSPSRSTSTKNAPRERPELSVKLVVSRAVPGSSSSSKGTETAPCGTGPDVSTALSRSEWSIPRTRIAA